MKPPGHIEKTPAGIIDWKMEALRTARLLADAERIIAEYKAQAIEAARGVAKAPLTDDTVERAWAAIVGPDVAPICFQASIVRADLRTALEAVHGYAQAPPSKD